MKYKLTGLHIVTVLLFICQVAYGATINYQYDDLHRLKQVDRSDGTITVYTYDDLGNRTSIVVTTTAAIDYYCDNDSDGYYDSSVDGTCSGANCPPSGCQATIGNDCNDSDNTIYPAATELCDNKDNDCNSGTIDGSGESWYGNPTSCGQGVCSSNGQLTCSSGSSFDTCTIGSPTGDDTDCDNLDDDCDGLIDEHYVITTTNCGTGVCSSAGQRECQSGTEVDTCSPGTPTESPEATCNDSLDNDCDGYIDLADGNCISSQIIIQPDSTEGMDVWITSVYYNGGLDNEYLRVGGWGDYYYSLIRFDLSGLPSSIMSAKIYLYAYEETNNTSMYIDRVTAVWDENTKWSGPSYTYMRTIPSPTINSWYSIDVTDLYNGWVNGTWSNYGIQLRPTDNWNKFNKFYSSDYLVDPALRPQFVIEIASVDYYCDYDNDGYISAISYGTCSGNGCIPVGCQIIAGNDCDDNDALEHPHQTWYLDVDGDGYSDGTTNTVSCTRPTGYKVASELIATSGDCNDTNPAINPATYWYPDFDGDSFGNPTISLQQCNQPAGYVLDSADCNDSDSNIYPGGPIVRITGITPAYYSTLQAAYDAAVDGDTIQVQSVISEKSLTANRNISLILKGGYDCGYGTNTGNTILVGTIVIENGKVTIESFQLVDYE